MRRAFVVFATVCLWLAPMSTADAQKKKKAASPQSAENEDAYYKLLTFSLPEGEILEAGGLEVLPDGKIALGTRRGEIWMIENGLTGNPKDAKFSRFARGMHEILGLAWRKDGWLYVTQRPDISRVKDSKGKGKADTFEVVTDGWEINGDYHEYAFGSRFDKDGNIWITLCLTGSFNSNSKFRGWGGKVTLTPDPSPKGRGEVGKFVPTTSGVRSPGGVGFNAEGDVFYTDNQGPWNGACGLKQLTVGGFVGHPDSFKWYKDPDAQYLGNAPQVPKSGSRIHIEAKKIPQFIPTAVIFPYQRMGQSASGIDCDLSGGKFGPFEKQLFVGDQTHSTIMRVSLEKVNGRYQGACYPFRQGFSCGIVPVRFAADGSLIAGGTSRGWGSRGGKPFSLERLVWTGKVPFEIREMKAKPDGFELTFTKEIDPATAGDAASYKMETFTYIYQAAYGSPEVDQTTPKITKVSVGVDKKSVRLYVDKLEEGHIHFLTSAGVRSAEGSPLLHKEAYYTMNYVPAK
jgi:glucose/arabinose dehydrogenase